MVRNTNGNCAFSRAVTEIVALGNSIGIFSRAAIGLAASEPLPVLAPIMATTASSRISLVAPRAASVGLVVSS